MTSTSMATIRRARRDDVEAISALTAELGYPSSAQAVAARLEVLLARESDVVLVAETQAHGVVGWIHGAEVVLVESDRIAEILGLVVATTNRTHGVGRALVAAVEVWAREQGFAQLSVRSNIMRAESNPFYAHIGFTRVKTQHVYRKTLGGRA